jgi:hypothetical protein
LFRARQGPKPPCHFRDQALEQIRRETAALAMVFAQHAEITFRNVDHALIVDLTRGLPWPV